MSKQEDIQKIWTLTTTCPVCGKKELIVEDYLYEMPLVGKVLISVSKCKNCNYKHNDVRAVDSHGPQRISFKVNEPQDLGVLVVRSSSATIKIPDLGIEITPGPAAQGFITTIEGILDRILDALSVMKNDPEMRERDIKEKEEEILKAKKGQKRFTLIIEDPEGVSRIISERAEKEALYKQNTQRRSGIDRR